MKIAHLPDDCLRVVCSYLDYESFGELLILNKETSSRIKNVLPLHVAKRIAHMTPNLIPQNYFNNFEVMLRATTRDYRLCLKAGEALKCTEEFKQILENSMASLYFTCHYNEDHEDPLDVSIRDLMNKTIGEEELTRIVFKLDQYIIEGCIDSLNLCKIRSVAWHTLSDQKLFNSFLQPSQYKLIKAIQSYHPGDSELTITKVFEKPNSP